jgi:hypothetical protein
MIELFIEKYQVDISPDFSTLLTFALDDIKDFGAKNTAYSKTIILPGTARNKKVFGNIFQVESGATYDPTATNINYNYNAAVSARAIIFSENIQVFKGVFRILEIIVDGDTVEFEASVTGELGGLVSALGNRKLEDLDFSAYDLEYSVANITASWDATPGSGVLFPLIDYGNYSTDKHGWKYGTFRPALYAKEYIDKLFTAAEYEYECALFDTDRFKALTIPHAQKILQALNTAILARVAALQDNAGAASKDIVFASGTLGAFTTADNATFNYAGATPTVTNIALSVVIESYTDYPDPVRLTIKKNGVIINQVVVTEIGTAFDLSINAITFSPGDYFVVTASSLVAASTAEFTANIDITSAAAIATTVLLGDTIKVNDAIPKKVLQKDFLSSIVKLHNLYIYEDRHSDKKVFIAPFVDFYDANPFNGVDYSEKIDRSKPMRIKPMAELLSRYYEFNFKEDSDFYNDLYKKRYNQNYGSYLYDSEFEFAHEKTTVEVIFAGSPLVGYSGEEKVYTTIFKRTGTTTLVEENTDSCIRLLQTKKVTGVASWNILDTDGTTVLSTQTAYGYAGHLDDPDAPNNDIHFGTPKELFFVLASGALNVNQFNVYWSPYMAEITDKDSRLVTATIRLTNRDIYALDFSKLVYVDGVLYRINKIADYNASAEDVCKIELIKVINLSGVGVLPTPGTSDGVYKYVADGSETTYLGVPALAGLTIILVIRGTAVLEMIPNLRGRTPTPLQVKFNQYTGTFTFGVDLNPDEVIQILYNQP